MPKSARGLQQKRVSKKQRTRAANDFDSTKVVRKQSKALGITPQQERAKNTEQAGVRADKRAIAKQKRERRKEAKAQVKGAKEDAIKPAAAQRALDAANVERRQRQAAAAAAAAARLSATSVQ